MSEKINKQKRNKGSIIDFDLKNYSFDKSDVHILCSLREQHHNLCSEECVVFIMFFFFFEHFFG